MPARYSFDGNDWALPEAADVLLKKVAAAVALRPAQLVSVAKLQHVLSMLPRVAPDLEVTVSVIGARRWFGAVETWHYWDVAVKGEQLSVSSGGHLYVTSTGGDTFTTMDWSAMPDEAPRFEDWRAELWMVPDVQSFSEGVKEIEFASGAYRVEIADPYNSLLSADEDGEDVALTDEVLTTIAIESSGELNAQPRSGDNRINDRPSEYDALVSAAMSVRGGKIPLEADSTFRLNPKGGDLLLLVRGADQSFGTTEFTVIDFWEFRDGDRLLITNREEDFPASVEHMELGGPFLWKVLAEDRLAWAGWRGKAERRTPTLVALIDCRHEGYVYGEPEFPTLDSVMAFGAPSASDSTPEMQVVWKLGYDAAVSLSSPNVQ